MKRIEALLAESALCHPGAVAIADDHRRATYAELAAETAELARALAALAPEPGARVAVLAKNRIEYAALYFAAAAARLVLVPLNWRLKPSELAGILADAEPAVVFAEPEFEPALELAREALGAGVAWILFGPARAGWRSAAELSAPAAHAARVAPADLAALAAGAPCSEVAVQMYTSGTTGAPKGALLTHANVWSMLAAWLVDMPLSPGASHFLQVTPLFHVGGMLMLVSCMAARAELRLLPEFLPGPAAGALEREGITHTLMVPAMLRWLFSETDLAARSFPALQLVVYGAAPMPPELLERAIGVLGCGFLQGYGLTETTGVLTTLRPADHVDLPGRLQSAGRAALCCEVGVFDAADRRIAPGSDEAGEVRARGGNVGPGYWRRPAETAESLREGWFCTGDVGRMDAEGFLTIVDRAKDMILVGGENVYPREVELALEAHPDVADVAVLGIPHDVWGEEVLAIVVARGARPDPRLLIQHCRARLARFKCPTRVEFAAELPRNAAGKLLKNALREPHWRGRARRV